MKKIIFLTIILSTLLSFAPPDDFIRNLSLKLDEFKKKNPVDQVIVIFNQEKYAVGDTAFFQFNLVDDEFLPIKGKRIISLGLFSEPKKQIQKINFVVTDGHATNQLLISPEVSPGIFHFVFYSESKKDLEKFALYSKEFKIVGKNNIIKINSGKEETNLQIHYEGGALVNGCENRIILMSNVQGLGKIKNSKNETIIQFNLPKEGITSVLFTPMPGDSYYAELDNITVRFPLMQGLKNKCTLKLDNLESLNSRKIKISTSPESSLLKKELYLVVTNRRKIAFAVPITFNSNGFSEVNLPLENMKDGISEATVLDIEGIVFAQRIFFVNKNNLIATAEPSSNLVYTRERMQFEFSLSDKLGNPIQTNFSCSVNQLSKGHIENQSSFPDEFFNTFIINELDKIGDVSKEKKADIIDMLLITKKKNLVPWSEVLSNYNDSKFRPANNLKIKGKVIFKATGEPVPDSTQIIGYLQNNLIGYVAHTNKSGHFELTFLYDFFGDDQLFYVLEYKGKELKEDYLIIPDEEGIPNLEFNTEYTAQDSIDTYGVFASNKKLVEDSYNFFYSNNKNIELKETLNSAFEDEAMGTDLTVNVQDYITFSSMEDLIKEVIPFLQTRKKNNVLTVRLLIGQNVKNSNYKLAQNNPLFLIDGVFTKSADYFLGLKPSDILKIKIINDASKLIQFGSLGKSGIVILQTKKPAPKRVYASSKIIPIQGLNKPVSRSWEIAQHNLNLPDIRANLLWLPSTSTNTFGKKIISLTTSDNTGRYIIRIKGVSDKGEPFEAEGSFEVAFK